MGKLRILVVDDEAYVRVAVGRWLQLSGHDVDTAEDGQEAVNKCAIKTYDAVILDLQMPRMDGRTALSIIRTTRPSLPVIILTGFAENAASLISEGASRVIGKPVGLKELEAELRGAIETGV